MILGKELVRIFWRFDTNGKVMTYCIALRVDAGLVFLSDARTNAGIDQVSTFRKMTLVERPGDRLIVMMSAGNLAITQAVRQHLSNTLNGEQGLLAAKSMYEAVQCVGDAVRFVYHRDAKALQHFGIDFNCSFIVGGQIGQEACRIFEVYSAGNFIESADEKPYLQIGESKYGKPILDRVIRSTTSLGDAAKCALVSMDSTLRSNLSVGLPLDMLVYQAGSLKVTHFSHIDATNEYFSKIHEAWGEKLKEVFSSLPSPVWVESSAEDASVTSLRIGGLLAQEPAVIQTLEQTKNVAD